MQKKTFICTLRIEGQTAVLGSPTQGQTTESNAIGLNDIVSNDKLSKTRHRVKRQKAKMKNKIFYVLFKGQVKLRQFLGRALRLGHAIWLALASSNEHENSLKLTKIV